MEVEMFKTNGRLSIKREGIISNVRPGQDGSVIVTIDGDDYVVSNTKLIEKCKQSIGKKVKLEGYSSLGKIHANRIK